MPSVIGTQRSFDPDIDVSPARAPLGFHYGPGIFGPEPEIRNLDDIRPSLRDPKSEGPNEVYAIAMDVGKRQHRLDLVNRHLVFGVVTFATGKLGREPIRSQGHVHKVSANANSSTPEIYEIWEGRAIVLMQEFDLDDPGRCFAIEAGPGEVVVVPPGWAHATISSDPASALTFGAWCDRDYGFVYTNIRDRGGMAWFATIADDGLTWEHNPAYVMRELVTKAPETYDQLALDPTRSIYSQYEDDPDRLMFVPEPHTRAAAWVDFIP